MLQLPVLVWRLMKKARELCSQAFLSGLITCSY